MYDYNALLNSIKGVFDSGATSTSLGLSLTTNYPITTDSIMIGDPHRITRHVDQYPAIIIDLINKEEEFANLGTSVNGISRNIKLEVEVFGMVYVQSTSRNSDEQAYTLARNMETLLRTNYKLAGDSGWDTALVRSAEFRRAYDESGRMESSEDTYTSIVKLNVEFTKYSIR